MGTATWRADLRCGSDYPDDNGNPAECNPFDADGFTCCSPWGWCGLTADHCDCDDCFDYAVTWREDLRCGSDFPDSKGNPAECNPFDADGFTCCSPWGWCGSTADHCDCDDCVRYYRAGKRTGKWGWNELKMKG